MPTQHPTCTNLRIRSVRDAEIILHGVATGRLPMVHRRLDDEDRLSLTTGCIYVWEERSSNPLECTGQEIQRFTEGRSWGPSRARDDFLLYYEKESNSRSSVHLRNNLMGSSQLIKQTYSVIVHEPDGQTRKWHLNAYYTQDTVDQLKTVDDIPSLRGIGVPEGRYVCARTSNTRRSSRSSARAGSTGERLRSTVDRRGELPSQPSPSLSISSSTLPSPSTSTSSPMSRLPSMSRAVEHHPESARRLAPLEYLQALPQPARSPVDAEALNSFRHAP
ncbi:uncharacterized protein B0H18DRAFT_1025478 [Fomitopsis serialis]|uniref:uncharacterized protein n=1 Tax=Fomitopsis serialis TaxID=139415 RepID=UPI002008816A|nr:uncharacterized protein B0H18DRAFT_1025478 [Neoantrodia serialis]KAH9920162.1 hypothetical protein B0H18DRAFT_1025478 [Neoantrodia serialis]